MPDKPPLFSQEWMDDCLWQALLDTYPDMRPSEPPHDEVAMPPAPPAPASSDHDMESPLTPYLDIKILDQRRRPRPDLDGDLTLWALPEELVAPSRRTIRRWLIGVAMGTGTLVVLAFWLC